MKQMAIDDAVWLHLEPPGESMHVTLVSVYDAGDRGPLSRADLQGHVEARLLPRLEVFGQRLEQVPFQLDFPYWVDVDELDLERHVRERPVQAPGDRRALLRTVADVHAEPLDKRFPLWDFTLVSGLAAGDGLTAGSFAIACRFHHAMVDGKSVLEVSALLHDDSPAPRPARGSSTPARRPAQAPSLRQLVQRASVHAVRNPLELLAGVSASLPALGAGLVRRRVRPQLPGSLAPKTRFNGPAGPARHLGLVEIELGRLRAVRSLAPGSTINDVVLATIGGALRSHLEALGELPADSLITSCPISLRVERPSDASLASVAEPAPGNQVSAMLVPLGTDIADPRLRLEAIAAATRQAKDARQTVPARILAEVQNNLQATASAAVSRLLLMVTEQVPLLNTIVSNVPGPQQPMYLLGRRLRLNSAVVALLSGLTLIHVATSYDGNLVISFVADAAALPDPEHYESLLRASLAELETAAA